MSEGRPTLGRRLRRARTRGLVGRAAEQVAFQDVLDAPEPRIVWLHAVGGVGKSALCRAWADTVRTQGLDVALVDLQLTRGTPERIEEQLAAAFDAPPGELADRLLTAPRSVLFFDTWELGELCDGWMREAFLPSLPEQTVVVIASREPPGLPWRTDPGWRELLLEVELQNLSREDAQTFLQREGVPFERHEALVALTRGHPLALTLAAQVAKHSPDAELSLKHSPRLLAQLMDRLVRRVPSEAHRRALRFCARARFTSEDVLRAVVGGDAAALFEWLRSLPFITESVSGLVPHALARDVIDADHRWRNPAGSAAMDLAITDVVLPRVRGGAQDESDVAFLDLVYLLRTDPLLKRFVAFEQLGAGWVDRPRADERDTLVAIAADLDGPEFAKAVGYWLRRRPEDFEIARSALGEPVVVMAHFEFERFDERDIEADATLRAIAEWVSDNGGLRAGERVIVTRFCFGRGASIFTRLRRNKSLQLPLQTPGVAFSFLIFSEQYEGMMTASQWHRPQELQGVVDAGFPVFVQDWRARPPTVFLKWLLKGRPDAGFEVPRVPALSRTDLDQMVRSALKTFTRDDSIESNPLRQARCISGGGFRFSAGAVGGRDGKPRRAPTR